MALRDDDKEFLRQLAWIYPSDYMAELQELAEAVIKEQLAAGERQNIRDIILSIMSKMQSGAAGNAVSEEEKAAGEAVQAEIDREIRDKVNAALIAGQLHIPVGMGPEVIIPLIEALADPVLSVISRSVLCQLSDGGAIDAFCCEWAKNRSAELEQILMQSGYLAAQPLGIRLLTVLKTNADRVMLAEDAELLPELLAAVDDPDRSIAGYARRLLLTLTNRPAVDTVCETVLADPDNERLQAWAVIAGYAPADDSRAALYFAITGQWDKYYALDWQEDRPLLTRGYNEASISEKQRFLAAARQGGQGLLLTGLLLTGNGRDEYEEITAADWEALLDLLVSQQRWQDLYRLVFKAPVEWSGEITMLLRNSGWQPEEWAQQGWERSLAACPRSGRNTFVPDGRELIVLETDQADIEALAFHPNNRIVAGGGRDGRLRLWQLGSPQIWRTVDLHAEAITAVAFTADGRYLATAGQEGKVHIWQLPAVKWVGSVSGQPGLVTAMATGAGGTILASAWAGGQAAARVWEWDGSYMTNQGQYPGRWFNAAAVSAEQRLAVGGGWDGIIRLYALAGSKQDNRCWAAHTGPVQSLRLCRDGKLLVSTGADGLLKIWQTVSGKLLWALPVAGRLLAVSTDGSLAAISNPGQCKILIQQLRLAKPLTQATHADWQHAGRLLAAAALEPETSQAVEFLQTILDSKFRYDIIL